MIARGGIFGIDRQSLPIPWDDVEIATGDKLLVLDAVKATTTAAPHVKENQNFQHGGFSAEGRKVDACWVAHVSPVAIAPARAAPDVVPVRN